jgi:tRNA pseudouridine38-40 synthase
MSRRLKLTISYDGTEYFGWQRQANQRSIQSELEAALRDYTATRIVVVASGRTDAGVHALAQVVSFDFPLEHSTEIVERALNFRLPRDIRILKVEDVADNFHAIRDTTKKRYRYQIDDVETGDLFQRNYYWHIPRPLDHESMAEAAKYLVGTHDFASFQAAGAPRRSTIRTIHELTVLRRDSSPQLWIEITANGFLYNMVRIICGSLVAVGKGKEPPQWLESARNARDRVKAGPTAPAQGLFLDRIWYGEED